MADTNAERTIAILDHFDLSSLGPEELRDEVLSWNSARAKDIAAALSQALQGDTPISEGQNVFDFFASSQIRGDACWGTECQASSLRMLARYASLYADRVIIPINFWLPDSDDYDDRVYLWHEINAVVQLRRVIEAGVLIPVSSPIYCYCPSCLKKQGVDVEKVWSAAYDLFEGELLDSFRLVYRPPKDAEGEARVEVQGPEEYIPHGRKSVTLPSALERKQRRLRVIDGALGALLSKATVKRQRLLSTFAFDDFVEDFVAQAIYRARVGTTYLTDSSGQARFLSSMAGRDGRLANTARLCAHLAHNVPAFADVPLDAILKLRANEPDAFLRYRTAINTIARDHLDPTKLVTAREAVELYYDVLQPRLIEIETLSKRQVRAEWRRSAAKVVASVLTVSLGITSGLVPAELGPAVAAIGGLKTVSDLIEGAASVRKSLAEKRTHELYFLVRLASKAGRNRRHSSGPAG